MEMNKQKFFHSAQLLRSFVDVHKNAMRIVQKASTENGLTLSQYSILMTIFPDKEMTQKELGEKTYLPKSTLSQAVDGLVQDGCLNRQQVEGNRREIKLTITKKGQIFFEKIHFGEGGIHQAFLTAIDHLTEQQLQELLEINSKISSNLENQGEC